MSEVVESQHDEMVARWLQDRDAEWEAWGQRCELQSRAFNYIWQDDTAPWWKFWKDWR